MKSYKKLCGLLREDLKKIELEIDALPNNRLSYLLNSSFQSIFRREEQKSISENLLSIASRLEKIRSKTRSSINTLSLSFTDQDSQEKLYEELLRITTQINSIAQEIERKAICYGICNFSSSSMPSAKDLPVELKLKVSEYQTGVDLSDEVLAALETLLKNGILSQQEYNEKVGRIVPDDRPAPEE